MKMDFADVIFSSTIIVIIDHANDKKGKKYIDISMKTFFFVQRVTELVALSLVVI